MQSLFGSPGKEPVKVDAEDIPATDNNEELSLKPLIDSSEVEELFGKPTKEISEEDVMQKTRDLRLSLVNYALKQKRLMTSAMGLTAIGGLLKDQEAAIQKERTMRNDLEIANTGNAGFKEALLEVFRSSPVYRGGPAPVSSTDAEPYVPAPIPIDDAKFNPGENELGKQGETYEDFMRRMNPQSGAKPENK